MLRTLRNRLILSHALPLLIIVPLMGIVLIYVLESQYLLPSLTRNLTGDALMIANQASDHPEIWDNPAVAQQLVDRLGQDRAEELMLLGPDGRLVAAAQSDPAQGAGLPVDPQTLAQALSGQVVARQPSQLAATDQVIDVLAPIAAPDGRVIGVARLTYRYETFYQEFLQLRYLIGGILLASLLVGVSLGSILAVNIGAPLQQVTRAVHDLASGRRSEPLQENGPEEVRQLQRAANQLVEQLHTLEESRRKLLANLVHELGRPLGALRSAIQALLRGAKSDPLLMEELLNGMDDEAARLQRLTEDLAELHDQVLGILELDCQPLAIGEWLAKVLLPWREAAVERGIGWETVIPAGLPGLWADPDRLSQAVGNLVSNALKYTPEGGKVRIDAGCQGQEAWIRVSDTGPGIPVDEQGRIFTPFYRGGHGRRFPQGMGLGLSITRDLVAAHGGRIELESAPGSGSRFTLWLPIKP